MKICPKCKNKGHKLKRKYFFFGEERGWYCDCDIGKEIREKHRQEDIDLLRKALSADSSPEGLKPESLESPMFYCDGTCDIFECKGHITYTKKHLKLFEKLIRHKG